MMVKSHKAEGGRRKAEGTVRTPPSPFPLPPSRSALTLIELLVVIIILTTIVGAAIPILSPANDDRRLREASRTLNTFITGAQARAIVARRPYGIALKRLGQDTGREEDNGVCLEAFYAEQPPPYAGFDANSRCCVALRQFGLVAIRFVTRGNAYGRTQDGLPVGWDADLFPAGTIRPGDVIESSGTRFVLVWLENGDAHQKVQRDSNGFYRAPSQSEGRQPVQILARPMNDSGQQIEPKHDNRGQEIPVADNPAGPFWTEAAPYKILRQPALASDQPYQLPEGAAIDLRASGLGIRDYFYVENLHDNSEPIVIMFSPEGKVSRVRYSQHPNNPNFVFDEPVSDNLFLLIGKRENVPPPVDVDPTLSLQLQTQWPAMSELDRARLRQPFNWLRGESRWVVIGSQTGRIVTIENALVDPLAIITEFTNAPRTLSEKSEELRNEQILAAREFTSEMRQLGGR